MKVLYFASARDWMKTEEEEITLDAPTTVAEFIKEKIEPRTDGKKFDRFLFAVNEEMVDGSHTVTDEDTLALLPPLSGGSGMTRIQTGDFDINEEIRLCSGDRSDIGGVVPFIGVTRDISHGKKIAKIELTHYSSMAEKQLEKLRQTTMEKFDVLNLTIVHRVGEIKTGEQIVGIVTVSRHRKNAFDACRFAIDELKKSVPIWKKEFTENGESWVESL